jgi:hypothetical protein
MLILHEKDGLLHYSLVCLEPGGLSVYNERYELLSFSKFFMFVTYLRTLRSSAN